MPGDGPAMGWAVAKGWGQKDGPDGPSVSSSRRKPESIKPRTARFQVVSG